MTLKRRSSIPFVALLVSGCAEPAFQGPRLPEAVREPPLATASSESLRGEGRTETIDLATVLRLAGAQNVDVEVLRARLAAAKADVDAAVARFLPELSLGVGYVRHDGRFQETRGDVFDVSRSSLGAGPGVRLHLDPAEAHFERLRAEQVHEAAGHLGERTRAEAVVRAAVLYLDLLKARGIVEVARDAVSHSGAQVKLSEDRVGLRAELRVNLVRARAELARDEARLLRAANDVQRASVELAVWLRLPPTTLLVPAEERIEPTELVDSEAAVDDLVARALIARPELRELQALQRAADESLAGARWSPWAPSVDVFASYGAFGGGRGAFFGDFGDRGDYGAALTWTFEGLGFGEAARYRRAQAESREAALRLEGLKEAIAGEVIRIRDEARSLSSRISAASSRVEAAREALELVRARFQAGDAIQLEVLESAREAAEARAELIAAIIEFNQLQHLFYYQVRGDAWSGR
jgi:outer membrane protein TolC